MNSQNKKHLLFVNGHLNVGGVEKSLVDLLRHLDYTKYDVDLLLLQDLGDYYEVLPKEVNVIYRNINHAYGPLLSTLCRNLFALRWRELFFRVALVFTSVFGQKALRIVKPLLGIAKQYDCAIAYRVGVCDIVVAYVVVSKQRLLWWHHGECNYTEEQILQTNKTWQHYDHVVTVSEACKRMLQEHFLYPSERYLVIPNLIDIERIKQMAGDVSPYSSLKDTLILVTVGRLSSEKHIDNVPLAARSLISKGISQFRWYIIGDGEEYDHIEQIIREQHVTDNVVLLGSKVNPYPYMKFANILVHTSYVESQSITVLEAMTLNVPCVVCKSLGPMEFMEDGKNGVLVGQGAEELAKGVKIMKEMNNLETIIQNASKLVSQRFSSQVIVSKFEGFI